MKCPKCQHENAAGSAFCDECGARLEASCPACGEPNRPGAKFCRKCGQLLEASLTPTAPESYTPKHLAQKILTSRAALEGERKQVTVLFADMKGSMELLAERDPEEARKILDPVLERMMEAVHRYEGTVNQVMGDGIMALFGAPLAHEDHAVRACYAALRMQQSVRDYAAGVQRTAGVPIQIRVGLNSGEVVVRSVGSDLKMDYTAVGQTTHLAARMEQMAMAGSILLTADTLRLAEDFVEVQPLGPATIKGLAEPIEVYEASGAGAAKRRFDASAIRGLTRFVGRAPELEQLRKSLDQAGAGHGQVVAVVGEPGVGKTRLFHEFTHSHRVGVWLILESGSVSYGKATPYLPLIDLLKAYFQIEPRDDARRVREKVSGKLLTLDEALLPALPVFLALLDVPVEDRQWEALDPSQRRQRMLETVKRLLLRESQVQPLLLVFEDLHWIDSETQALLESLVTSLPTARILLLVNYRPEHQHGWSGKSYYRLLRLDPLLPASAREVLDALLGDDPGLVQLRQLLIDKTQGNPLFLEESVRTLVETRALRGERGAYRITRPVEAIQVPATVQAMLAARIDRLSGEDKRLLQSAAVIGHEVPFTLLQAVADSPEEPLRQGLAHLQAAEFLFETRLFPEPEYTFKHALTHEVAYGSLLQDRRSTLHGRIAAMLERLYPDRIAEHVDSLAHHSLRGELWDKAVSYFRQAGEKAAARSANREAAVCFEQALAALRHVPESRASMEQAVDLRFELRNPLFVLGEHGRIIDLMREAKPIAERLGDQRRMGRFFSHMTAHSWLTGDAVHAIETARRALELAQVSGDVSLKVVASYRFGQIHHFLGDYPRAIEIMRSTIADLESRQLVHERLGEAGITSVTTRLWLCYCLFECGELEEAIAKAKEALRIAESVDHHFSLVGALYALGGCYSRLGDFHNAIPLLEDALRRCEEWNIRTWWPPIAYSLGTLYARTNRADGMPLLEQACQQAISDRNLTSYGLLLASLAEARLLNGRVDDALEAAQRGLEFTRERKARGQEAWVLRVLGEIHANRQPEGFAQASEYFGQALALATELGMRPLVAHCHLGLGRLYNRAGDEAKASEQLSVAATMYREMAMPNYLKQVEVEMEPIH